MFISYKYEDSTYRNGLQGFLQNPNNSYDWVPDGEKEDQRQEGEDRVKSYLRGIIGNCEALICLVGHDTHSSSWVNWELEVATSQSKRIVAVRIPKTNGGAPPLIWQRNISIIEWDARAINNALDGYYY